MGNKFLWEEQLAKFERAYLSEGIAKQYKSLIQERGVNPNVVKNFIPREAFELYTANNNVQYHLNGRSILGVQRKWILERQDDKYKTKHGCSINTGLIQSDHSGFMTHGNMGETFIEAKNPSELLDSARRLLSLSNEEMAREFNIMSSQSDIATLFNAIILDPIIDYEIDRDNFGGYSHCWNDENAIILSTREDKDACIIGLQDSADRAKACKTMVLQLPNGESISFKQNFTGEKGNEYTIDDVSTEIIEIKGNSKVLQKVVAQIERFSKRELVQQDVEDLEPDDTYLEDEVSEREEQGLLENDFREFEENPETPEEILDKQIILKKLQLVLDSAKDDIKSQDISMEEFDLLLNNLLYLGGGLNSSNRGYSASAATDFVSGWNTAIPVEQYIHIRLPNDRVLSIEFFERENNGRIAIKSYGNRTSENRDDVEDIVLQDFIDEQEVFRGLEGYMSDLPLKELLAKRLEMKEAELSSLEAEAKIISEAEALIDQQKEGQNIGEE